MSDQVRESLQGTIGVVKRAVGDIKRDVIAAIRNDDDVDVQQLRRLQKLSAALEAADKAYRTGKGSERGSSKVGKSGRAASPDRVKRGASDHVPASALRVPILQAIRALGGEARSEDVLNEVAKSVALQPNDLRGTQSHPDVARWRNSAAWVRYDLTKKGYVDISARKRGVWTLTSKGQELLQQLTASPGANGQ